MRGGSIEHADERLGDLRGIGGVSEVPDAISSENCQPAALSIRIPMRAPETDAR